MAAGFAYDFRDEEQVKQYLDNIEIEYKFSCFGEKNSEGCHRLADYFEAVRPNIDEALQIYRMNCDRYKFGHSCYKLAKHMMLGKDIKCSPKEIMEYHDKGCQYGYSESCHTSAIMQMDPNYVGENKNIEKSAEYYKMGCDKNHRESCSALGEYYRKGRPGLPIDIQKCLLYHKKGCDLESLQSCINLNVMYRNGIGVENDIELANKYRERAKIIYDNQYVPKKNLKGDQSKLELK